MRNWVRWTAMAMAILASGRASANDICQLIGKVFEQGPKQLASIKGAKDKELSGDGLDWFSCDISYGSGSECSISEFVDDDGGYNVSLTLSWLQSDLTSAIEQAERLALTVDECGLEGPRLSEKSNPFRKRWRWSGPGVEDDGGFEETSVSISVTDRSRSRVGMVIGYWILDYSKVEEDRIQEDHIQRDSD